MKRNKSASGKARYSHEVENDGGRAYYWGLKSSDGKYLTNETSLRFSSHKESDAVRFKRYWEAVRLSKKLENVRVVKIKVERRTKHEGN